MRIKSLALVIVIVASTATACAEDDSSDTPTAGRVYSGPLIAFKRFDPKTEKVRLYTIRPDGSGLKALTRPGPNANNDSDVDFSPDGRRIAFMRDYFPEERGEILVARRDGKILRSLTRGNCKGDCVGDGRPDWSPDGRRIAFQRIVGPVPEDGPPPIVGIFVMDADGSNVRQLTQLEPNSGAEDDQPSWSPDGSRIAFMRSNNTKEPVDASAIYTVGSDGSDLRLVRRMPRKWPGAGEPDWSPDGKRLLFSTFCAFGGCGQPPTGAQLFTVKPNGRSLKKLTDLPGNSYQPAWSPDGKKIVFARHRRLSDEGDIYTMRADGTRLRRLTNRPKLDSHRPDWGPPVR